MWSVLAIIIPLLLLVVLIWKKVNIAVSAILCTGLMAFMSSLNVYDSLTVNYMEAFVGYIESYWPLIFLGASFGKAMQLGGGAEDLANLLTSKLGTKYTIAVLCVTTLVLAYGGVSCYVIVFVIYPIALNMFKKADLPRHLIPAVVAAGAFTAVNLGPGSPSVVNNIPVKYLGTSATVLPVFSAVIAASFFLLATAYCIWQEKVARKKGEHFSADEETLRMMAEYEKKEHGNGAIAFIPLAIVVFPLFFGVDVLYTLLVGWIAIGILYWKKIDNKIEILNCGVSDAMGAIVATSAVVGFGGVAMQTAGYTTLVNTATNMGGSPLISFSLGTALLSGACGSGSGGLTLALETLAPRYIEMGINPGVLHKIASAACITLDSLPHNGVMVTVLACCGLTHKEGYRHLFAITVVGSTIILIETIILASIFYPIP
mgnify:FL=1